MEKENGDGDAGGKPPPDKLLDAAGLFGAYWGRDGASNSSAAAQAQAQAQAQAALFGFGGRYPAPSTLGVAANQAAQLGLHPAASAAWWSMASHLAAQDYLHRLQASGLSFGGGMDPYSALSALQPPKQQNNKHASKGSDRSGRSSSSSASAKEKSPATSTSSSQPSMRTSYGFPKTSSPSAQHAQASLNSLASLNNLVSAPHQSKPSSKQSAASSHSRKSSSSSSSSGQKNLKERELALLRGDLMLAQAAAQGAYHAAVAHAAKGKNISSLYPFGMGGDKDGRHGIDSLTGLPHTILSAALEGGDPSSVLGGVRLPPDTEIIKYTSSLAGPKAAPGSTNRGRKKTISLDPPQVSVHPSGERGTPLPSKRQKVDEYGNSRSAVEVIRLPNRQDRGHSLSDTPPPNLGDYAGISRELLQTIASQSGVSLAALEKQLAGTAAAANADSGLNLSTKSGGSESQDLSAKTSGGDEDGPLNLSLKPSPPSSHGTDALSRLTSLSSSLNASSSADRISRRKPGAKPRRVAPEPNAHIPEAPRPKSSGSEDSESISGWPSREGRPRNLGRGVSKPKKNTVASLLAQSRALGLRPALAQHLLADSDLDKLKALLGESCASTDSECPSDSPSDSDVSETARDLRAPLHRGWKRTTVIKGLSRNCNIKGDVSYSPPEPHSALRLKSFQELHAFLEANPTPGLSSDNFSFSARVVLGDYMQASPEPGEPRTLNEQEITKRLEEARALASLTGRPTPPPVDRRIELARRQQAARDARRDATNRSRDQARLVRELERTERAELAKREKEAKRKRNEELERQKIEEQNKRQQERELKRQQALLLKEQQKYITEERERRRQHTTFIRQLDARRRWEERERRKHQNLLDRLLVKEKKLQQRRKEMQLLSQLRRPQEDSTLSDHKPLPALSRVPGLALPGEALSHALQVLHFIHYFGHHLGFDMDNLPTLNTLQLALLPDCSVEAEEELTQLLQQLLECAIEDPGIPHPGRHTTLLGHAIRISDITPANISEVLRIYLYANATGEVKTLTGLSSERERERRIADHHQTDIEMQHTQQHTKNTTYYEHLHNNSTYKLSEALRDKPFLALNATTKAKILAYLCDELLQNKTVLRQIDASLEHLNQLKKERYLMDMKIRKVKVLHQRKIRAEQTEKQQALALERMQRLVEESTANLNPTTEDEDKDKEPSETEGEKETTIPDTPPSPNPNIEESDKELSPLKDVSNSLKGKELCNNNKDEGSPADNGKDKDSVMGDCDAVLSDLESEGTQPEEDEDKSLSCAELARKLDKLLRQSEQQQQQLLAASHALRATSLGQDRYWRRYWSLGKCGGILVEAMESAQPEILHYHEALEASATRDKDGDGKRKRKRGAKNGDLDKALDSEAVREEALKTERELKSIKSELNLSDHTQIIKYEPNMKHGACKIQGSSIKMEEKYMQHKQTKEEDDMLDIEDSIPTAFLVQKPTHTPMFATQAESLDKPQEIVKVENLSRNEEKTDTDEVKDQLVDNLEELRKMAEAVSSQLDAAKKAEEIKEEIKEEKPEVKQETVEADAATELLYAKMLEGKWFSILRHESSVLSNINDVTDIEDKIPTYRDNEQTCSQVVMCQGHKWDVSNNLYLLNDPSLFTLNSMVTSVQVPSNNIYTDSCLTLSGIDQEILDNCHKEVNGDDSPNEDIKEEKEDNDLEKELQADALKVEATQKAKANSLTSLGLLNFNALSTYVTCDSPPPIPMTPDEIEQLENCKVNGLPKKVEGSFVPKDLRHGWWRITDPDQLQELLDCLHPRGVRERELHASILQHIPTVNNKLYIDGGDASTELSPAHPLPPPPADSDATHSAATQRRAHLHTLATVEALEERVSAASMQVKGWRVARTPLAPDCTPAEILAVARSKLAALEAHIERRYLKPPLVQRYASTTEAAAIGAAMQAEANTAAHSPQGNDNSSEGKDNHRGISRGLVTWREAVARCNTAAQLAMMMQALEAAVAWDKSIMKANCQFCLCGDDEDQLLLCDGCDKGYHTYCFKPRMDKIPEGDWYCWECVNKARGSRVCIVCGGGQSGRSVHCALCPRAYHLDCHYPPLAKNPRGKWYCANCVSRAPPKKPRNTKKRESRHKDSTGDLDHSMVPSPAPSHASTSTTAEDCSASVTQTPEKCGEGDKMADVAEPENGIVHHPAPPDFEESDGPSPEKRRATSRAMELDDSGEAMDSMDVYSFSGSELDAENVPLLSRAKKEKTSARRAKQDLASCKNLLSCLECHEHAWPFLLPVNTKQFPQYKKAIKTPMDLSTIKRKLQEGSYKHKGEFASDVRLIFSNCEEFNEDYSPVGRAGHCMRQYFEQQWAQM